MTTPFGCENLIVCVDFSRGYVEDITGEEVLKIETVFSDHVPTGINGHGVLFRGVFVGEYAETARARYGETDGAFLIDGASLYRIAPVTYDDIVTFETMRPATKHN